MLQLPPRKKIIIDRPAHSKPIMSWKHMPLCNSAEQAALWIQWTFLLNGSLHPWHFIQKNKQTKKEQKKWGRERKRNKHETIKSSVWTLSPKSARPKRYVRKVKGIV